MAKSDPEVQDLKVIARMLAKLDRVDLDAYPQLESYYLDRVAGAPADSTRIDQCMVETTVRDAIDRMQRKSPGTFVVRIDIRQPDESGKIVVDTTLVPEVGQTPTPIRRSIRESGTESTPRSSSKSSRVGILRFQLDGNDIQNISSVLSRLKDEYGFSYPAQVYRQCLASKNLGDRLKFITASGVHDIRDILTLDVGLLDSNSEYGELRRLLFSNGVPFDTVVQLSNRQLTELAAKTIAASKDEVKA